MSDAQAKKRTPLEVIKNQIMSPTTAEDFRRALPSHISTEKFQRIVVTAVSKNPDLQSADRVSLFTSCIECAQDGLVPDGKEAALVIFNTKIKVSGKNVWIKKVQYMPMIAGIRKLVRNSGDVKFFTAEIVNRNDHFVYEKGFSVRCEHTPNIDDPGEMRGVYAIAETNDGTRYADYMSVPDVEKIRAKSKVPNGIPWTQHYDEMAKKTVARKLSKVLPLTSEVEKVIQRIDADYAFEQSREMHDVTPPAPKREDYAPSYLDSALDNELQGEIVDEETGEVVDVSHETEPETSKAHAGPNEARPAQKFILRSSMGDEKNHGSIDEWQGKALEEISKISGSRISLEGFRQRHGSIFAELHQNFSEQVEAVGNAIDEALTALK